MEERNSHYVDLEITSKPPDGLIKAGLDAGIKAAMVALGASPAAATCETIVVVTQGGVQPSGIVVVVNYDGIPDEVMALVQQLKDALDRYPGDDDGQTW